MAQAYTYFAFGVVPASIFLYSISRPDEDGHRTAFGKYLGKQIADAKEKWETKNHLMTAALQQAAHDKHLFYGVEKNSHVELKYPEYVPNSQQQFSTWSWRQSSPSLQMPCKLHFLFSGKRRGHE